MVGEAVGGGGDMGKVELLSAILITPNRNGTT